MHKIPSVLILLIAFIAFFGNSCGLLGEENEKETEPPEEPLPPIEPITSNTIFPFAVGNQWTYVDSLFTEDSVYTDTYTVRIESKRHVEDEQNVDRNLVWWKFNRRFNPSVTSLELAAEGDTVYSLQETVGGSPPDYEMIGVTSREYIIPAENDTLEFTSRYDGDGAYLKYIHINKDDTTIAANDKIEEYLCLKYSAYHFYSERVVPGIGMVYLEIIKDSTVSEQDWIKRRIHLTDYQIQ